MSEIIYSEIIVTPSKWYIVFVMEGSPVSTKLYTQLPNIAATDPYQYFHSDPFKNFNLLYLVLS